MRGPLGFRGQGMDGRKSHADALLSLLELPIVATSGAGSVTAPRSCWALIIARGPGASGTASVGASGGAGGGSGAVLMKRVRLSKGQTISYSVGAPGAAVTADDVGKDATDTTVTLPSAQILTSGGGKGPVGGTGGLGGAASGGDINRPGGKGGNYNPGAAGETPPYGGAGGALGGLSGGGAGAPGFPDIATGLAGGAGSAGNSGAGVAAGIGAGSGGNGANTAAGGLGRVIIVLVRAA